MTKEVWEKREEGTKMLVEYVKTSDYTTDYRDQYPNRNEIRMNQKRRRKPQMDKEKDNKRQRKLELKKRNVKMKRKIKLCRPRYRLRYC
jgi:hypothetical protein